MSQAREELFVAALDHVQEYLRLQEALGEALRAGHLNMAKARYAMGPKHVSWLQHPKHMDATARLCVKDDGEVQLTAGEAVEAVSPTSPPSAPEAVDALSTALSGMELAGGGDILGELAAKYECDYPPAPLRTVAGPRSPLLWYGQLVPPALKEAQSDFKSALELSIDLVNARRKLLQSIAGFAEAASFPATSLRRYYTHKNN